MSSESDGRIPTPDVTVVIDETRDCAASALVQEGLAALAFFRFEWTPSGDVLVLPLELWVFGHTKGSISAEELSTWLDSWEEPESSRPFNVTQARLLPLGILESATLAEARRREGAPRLAPLGPDAVDKLVTQGALLGFRSTRDARSHLLQLVAVDAYLEALGRGDSVPMRAVAERVGGTLTRARQLIVYARTNGYLTKPGYGQPGGQATDKAHELVARSYRAYNETERSSR